MKKILKTFYFVLCFAMSPSAVRAVPYAVDPPPSVQVLRSEGVFSEEISELPLIVLAPFKDRRMYKELHRGRSKQNRVQVVVPKKMVRHPAWSALRPGDLSFHLNRYLGVALVKQGYNLEQIDSPMSAAAARDQAVELGGVYIFEGAIRKLKMRKKGADLFFGTSVSGYYYYLESELDLRLVNLATHEVVFKKTFENKRKYHNNKFMGSSMRETYPKYFAMGMPWLANAIAEIAELRTLGGVPDLTPTPTRTPPGLELKTQVPEGAVLTATPTPRYEAPHWINPNTGKKMNPSWKFDPFDGTPRSKFIFINPEQKSKNSTPRGRRGSRKKIQPTPTLAPTPDQTEANDAR